MIADKIRAEKIVPATLPGTWRFNEAIEKAAQIAEENSGWISVDTRLPDKHCVVIVFQNYTPRIKQQVDPKTSYWVDVCEYDEEFIPLHRADEHQNYDWLAVNTTHWQPLPQPPEAGESKSKAQFEVVECQDCGVTYTTKIMNDGSRKNDLCHKCKYGG